MPKIPTSHRVAQRAVLAVSKILDDAGAMSEQIVNDYGEDLMVQTQLRDVADNFHTMVQVKGVTKLRRSGKRRGILVDMDHLRRWIALPNPFILCVYEDETKSLFACVPALRYTLWDASISSQKYRFIDFDEKDIMTAAQAEKLIWICRFQYFSRLIAMNESWRIYHQDVENKVKVAAEKEINVISAFFLNSLHIMIDNAFVREFLGMIANAARFLAKNQTDDDPLEFPHVMQLCLLGWVDAKMGIGFPVNLMDHSTIVAMHFFQAMHPTEFRKANEVLSGWKVT